MKLTVKALNLGSSGPKFEHHSGSLCCALEQDTCLFLPRIITACLLLRSGALW